ncbi:hypothetical protein GCM10011519_29180 [Marmoricola endophyticus]|uniref:MobA-like NTP transferase domain-containing protein n=1 Tax=Marmoricola endophyticus TaxID=2040280 RepID=A0A917BQQ1_9ACTN|nr:NTP transferase domain-containing protein [Marmoricola endophyticus]GGF53425.1 hypothetical protein GCM10011519_29180 [Marmoricola endophyticus]
MTTTGLLLAAGAGRRMGRPKALVEGWLAHAVASLADCDDVVVVLGARAEEARALVPEGARVTVAEDWVSGMGASLAAGLALLEDGTAERALVTLVDLPDVGRDVCARVLAGVPAGRGALARASYDDVPGHPVLLGRDHWAGVRRTSAGDRGARDYLREHPPVLVECGDLATGADQDRPPGTAVEDPNPGPTAAP